MLPIRVQPDGSPTAYDVFFTHTQDMLATADARQALYGELSQLADCVERWADPDAPTLILGDLNVPAGDHAAHGEVQQRLRGTADLWRVSGGAEADGRTFVATNNFYADPDDNPRLDQRLDYVLLASGARQVPILDEMRVLRIERDGRFVSDPFGLLARFPPQPGERMRPGGAKRRESVATPP